MCNQCPPVREPWTAIDDDTLQSVCEELKLTKPVQVHRTFERDGADGTYHGHESDRLDCHYITLAANLDAKSANWSLLHELGHAVQHESTDDPLETDLLYQRFNRTHGYDNNPMEIHADAIAAQYEKRFRVVR